MSRGQPVESAMYLKAHRVTLALAISMVLGFVGLLAPLTIEYCRNQLADQDVEMSPSTMTVVAWSPWGFGLAAGVVTALLLGKEWLFDRALSFAFNLLAIMAVMVFVVFFLIAWLTPIVGLLL